MFCDCCFIVVLIWAQLHDMKDVQQQKPHWIADNLAEDHYFYEVIVQTGPMLSHDTESIVQFILTGEDTLGAVNELFQEGCRGHIPDVSGQAPGAFTKFALNHA